MAEQGGMQAAGARLRGGRRGATVATVGLLASLVLGCGAPTPGTDASGVPSSSSGSSAQPSTAQPAGGRSTSSTVDTTTPTSSPGAGGPTVTPPRETPTSTTRDSGSGTGGASEWQVVGTSVRGRPLRVARFGTGPRHVLWIGGIHGNEPEGSVATAQLPDAFLQSGLGATVTLTILEDANPDGRAANTRGNANGVDVNRNFPAQNFDAKVPEFGGSPLSQPEAKVIDSLLTSERPDLVMVMHSWANKQFINFDGPARSIAEQFSKQSGMPVEASDSIAATPGSLGSYFGVTKNKPILTVEFARGLDKAKAWSMIREAALTAIRG